MENDYSSRLVPSKGLEPPHRCRYMDLNHARLPIPPRWQSWTAMQRQHQGRRVRKINTSILQTCQSLSNPHTNSVRSPGIYVGTAALGCPVERSSIAPHHKPCLNPTSPSSKSSHSTPSIPDSLSPPLPRISETSPRPLPEPCPPHRYGSM